MNAVTIRREKITIPTYEVGAYDKNPMFLDKRVYQGSSGRVYPHPVCESVSDVKTEREYNAVFLENDYILAMILPELGGRVQRLYDKTNGYDAVYYNEVIKPALVGLAGPWISGGIEFNWPQHHRPSTYDIVDVTTEEHDDGSATVWVGETERMFHTKCTAGFTLYPDRAYLEITARLYNPTDRPQTFLWWANPAVAVNDDTQSVFPPDVTAVYDHGKRDVSKFPIADGVYYKVDYSPGTDISRYKNIPVPTSYMAYRSDFDFIGNYDHKKRAGLLHIADHHISPGKKQWTWGNGDFGRAWDRNLTDENGPYIELMTGVFTDNQPDFTFLKPYEEKTFTQYFMPYRDAGAVKNANLEAVLNVEAENGKVTVTVYSPSGLHDATILVMESGRQIYNAPLDVDTAGTFTVSVDDADAKYDDVSVMIMRRDGKIVLSHFPQKYDAAVPDVAEALPEPSELETCEKLFLAATHLEQYRHATRSPEPYYLEGLRRDPGDIRLNNGYGKYLYTRGRFEESIPYFRAAVKSATWKNPNPYDCEPYYNLGLALEAVGDDEGAYDAYYKATWDGDMQGAAFYRLALIASKRWEYAEALGFVSQSLLRGAHNMNARTLKTALLRRLGKVDEAISFAKETMSIDMLDFGCRYEICRLTGEGADELDNIMRGDAHNYIELALVYIAAEMGGDAVDILARVKDGGPMTHYYLYYCGIGEELDAAESADYAYCFPNRLFDIAVLKKAIEGGGERAKYYLGLLYYDKGRRKDAASLWEDCADRIGIPTVYRNLALAYYNEYHDGERALASMERAFALDETDARVFYERDILYRMMNTAPETRLSKLREHEDLALSRDDLCTEYITLLITCGEYEYAYELMMSRRFHPWEGGEGKITAQYRRALMKKAEAEPERAVEYLTQALTYPENLGEGKLAGCLDNDIYYLLGKAYESVDADKSRHMYEMAARGEFGMSAASYYNDQPPEMMYYASLAKRALGETDEAKRRFDSMRDYMDAHIGDEVKIDYFAVSLPDFSVFDADLDKKNRVHCLYMGALGSLGVGDKDAARECAQRGLALDGSHTGLRDLMDSL